MYESSHKNAQDSLMYYTEIDLDDFPYIFIIEDICYWQPSKRLAKLFNFTYDQFNLSVEETVNRIYQTMGDY